MALYGEMQVVNKCTGSLGLLKYFLLGKIAMTLLLAMFSFSLAMSIDVVKQMHTPS